MDVMSESNAPELKLKMKVKGKVIKTTLAGALVDIGSDQPAILHISQLGEEPVKRVEDVVKAGQEIEVWVRRIDKKNNRVELTMTEPLALEWREIKKGMVVKGTVTRLEKFGAFIEVGAERPGLAHISELTHDYIRSVSDFLKVGQEVEAKVLGVNRRKKQIKLSLKALQAPPPQHEEEVDNTPPPTAMEMALRKAMENGEEEQPKQESEEQPSASKKDQEIEDLLARTLERRVSTQ
jgi:small subunit ribosomal protein S1